MRYTFPQVIFGFHGCDRSVGEALLSGKIKHLTASRNTYDWLGHGVYFWENSPQRALQWAQECAKSPKKTRGVITDPFVVGAIINVGNCLNLTATEDKKILLAAYHYVEQAYGDLQKPLPANTESMRDLDCVVINAAVTLQQVCKKQPFDTVRGAFVEGNPIYPGAKLFSKTHVQVCVRNPQCICGYFRPSEFVTP